MFEFNTNAVVTLSLLGLFLSQTMLCQFGLVSPLQYYHSVPLIIRHGEVWRIISSVFYLGPTIDIEYAFHLLFFVNYSTQLELIHFRNKRLDFIFMLFFIIASLNILPSLVASMTPFATSGSLVLSGAFIHIIVYIWSRHNQNVTMALFGVISFKAPYLPLVLLVFSYVFGSRNVENELIGIFIGHVYFFFKFLTPVVFQKEYLPTPRWFKFICTKIFGDIDPVVHLPAPEQQQQQQQQQAIPPQPQTAPAITPVPQEQPHTANLRASQHKSTNQVDAAPEQSASVEASHELQTNSHQPQHQQQQSQHQQQQQQQQLLNDEDPNDDFFTPANLYR